MGKTAIKLKRYCSNKDNKKQKRTTLGLPMKTCGKLSVINCVFGRQYLLKLRQN